MQVGVESPAWRRVGRIVSDRGAPRPASRGRRLLESMLAERLTMDPTPPDADGVAHAAESGRETARTIGPAAPFAKPVSRSFVAIVAIVLAGMTGLAWL